MVTLSEQFLKHNKNPSALSSSSATASTQPSISIASSSSAPSSTLPKIAVFHGITDNSVTDEMDLLLNRLIRRHVRRAHKVSPQAFYDVSLDVFGAVTDRGVPYNSNSLFPWYRFLGVIRGGVMESMQSLSCACIAENRVFHSFLLGFLSDRVQKRVESTASMMDDKHMREMLLHLNTLDLLARIGRSG